MLACDVNSCDDIVAIPRDAFDDEPVGLLDEIARARLDRARRYVLDIVY